MMGPIKNCVSIVLITIVLFLAFDLMLSRLAFNPNTWSDNNITTGVAHPVYHHDLKQNLDIITTWGPIKYRLCTNQFGFKVSCNNAKEIRKDFDVAFIGDSFTEAIGMTYEDSFVGLYAQKHPDIAVANFGVRSYSPSIYWKKIEFLLNNGFTFKHLVVLPDTSDIRDEAFWYAIDEKSGAVIDNAKRGVNEEENTNIQNQNSFHIFLMKYFKFTWYINCIINDFFSNDEAVFKDVLKNVVEHPAAAWTRNIDSAYSDNEEILNGLKKCLEYMRNLKQLLDKHNIKMTVVVYPWPTQLFFVNQSNLSVKIWKDFCIQEKCYNYIDANQFFFDAIQKSSKIEVIKKYYIHDDTHFNEEGNKKIFEMINTYLKQ